MVLIPANVDYTNKDFDSLRSRLIALVKSAFPEWTDFDVASFGNILLEMFAFVGDTTLFYQDNQARESRLATATQRKNVIALARMLNYKLHGARAATVGLVLSIDGAEASPVRIAAGTIARTNEVTDPVVFQLLSDVTISPGQTSTAALGEHSKSHVQQFDSTGLANLDLYLDFTPYIDDSAVVSTTQGAFTQVDNFLDSKANDLHFIVVVDQNDRALVRFGNGVNGTSPTGTVTVKYKTGGGASGIVDRGTIKVIEGVFLTDTGKPVRVSVTNPSRSAGGLDRQSIEAARVLAPQSLRATERSVCREDFEIHAMELPGVARALMLTSNEEPSIAENTGILYVVPAGGGIPTDSLKGQVFRQISVKYPHTLTFTPLVRDPVYKKVDVIARVWLRAGYSESVSGASIRAALAAFFQVTNADGSPNTKVDFGFNMKDQDGEPVNELSWSDVFNVVRDATGVRKVGTDKSDFLLNGLASDVTLLTREFPVLGNVVLINGATGNAF